MKKILLGTLCVGSMVLFAGCTNKTVEETSQSPETTQTEVVSGDLMPPEPNVSPNPEGVRTPVSNVMAVLEAVGDYEGEGYAAVNSYDESYEHTVTASIGAPAEGSVYEGWLVNQQTGEFFSTGVMEAMDGVYTLEYSSEGALGGYTFVVITEETVVDDIPEAHVLEGKLK